MKLIIRNKFIFKILSKLFRLEPLSVVFKYEKTIYDSEVTNLGFLNQVKEEFSEQSEKFLQQLEKEIEEEVSTIK